MRPPNPNPTPTNSKIKNALKSAARLHVRRRRRTAALTPASGSGSSSSSDEASGVTGARSISASVTPTTASPTRTAKPNHLRRGLRVSRLGLGFGLHRKGKGLSNGSGRNTLGPIEGETPWVFLRVQVVGCTDLLAKDRNGFSDPFASVSLPPHPTRHATPVSRRTLNPLFPPLLSTFDFPIYRSLADRLGVLEIVLWDKDFFGLGAGGKGGVGVGRKEYLGEVAIALERWFEMNGGRAMPWLAESETGNGLEFELPLVSARSNTHARGKVKLRLGFVRGDGSEAETEQDAFDNVYEELLSRSRPSLVNIPPTQGVGTVRSHRSRNDVPLPLVAPITDDQHTSVHAPDSLSAYSASPHFGGSTRTVTSASIGIPPEVLSGYQDLYSAYNTYGTDGVYEDDGGLSSEDEGGFTEAESELEDAQEGEGRVELEEEEGDSEYEEVEVEVSDSESESETESESDLEYSEGAEEEQDAYSEEEETSNIQTPTLSPTATIVPGGTSPMTTPTAPASGSHPPTSSFSALYENQSSIKPPARPNTIRRASAPAPTHALAASTSAPSTPSHSPSPVDLVVVEAATPISGLTDVQPKLTLKSQTQQRDGRSAPPPALNLTPASPEILAPIPISLSSPLSQALSASPTSSLGPQIQTEVGAIERGPVGIGIGAPTSSPSRSRFRLSPTRAATAPYSIPSSPTKPTLTPTTASRSSILPRIPLPGISGLPKPRMSNPLRRNTSPGVSVTAPSTPTGAELTKSHPGTMTAVYDLTEDLAVPVPSGSNQNRRPSLPLSQPSTSTSNGNVTDPGLDNTESQSTKKSRFRKSWSGVGVRRPRDKEASSSSSASASTPGVGVGGSDYMVYANVDPMDTVNMDAATQAMLGGVVRPPGTAGEGAMAGVKKRKKIGIKRRKKEVVTPGGGESIEGGGGKSKVAKTKKIKIKKIKVKKVTDKGKGKEQDNLTHRKRPRLGTRRTRPSYRLGPSGVGGSSNHNGGNDVYGYGDGDIVGIVMVEIEKAEDLPRLRNITRTGWDMDPFVVISFGKKVFRTRVIRHSLNPVWDEKLLFHVRRYETGFKVQLTILDWDKLSSNDYIGECDFGVADLIEAFESGRGGVDPETGLYPLNYDSSAGTGTGGSGMKEFQLPLKTAKEMPWEAKHRPVVTFRAKYQPYAALRQRFWFQYLKQYDTDDTGMISHLELTSMLDSLGSTLSWETVMGFWTRFGKNPHGNGLGGEGEELTMAEAIQCLEIELGRPEGEKRWVGGEGGTGGDSGASTDASTYGYGYGYSSGGGGGDESSTSVSIGTTPVLMLADRRGNELSLDQLDFSGPPLSAMVSPGMFQDDDGEFSERDRVPAVKGQGGDDGNGVMRPLVGDGIGSGSSGSGSGSLSGSGSGYGLDSFSLFDGEKLNLMEYPASASAFGFGSNGNNGNGIANGTSKVASRPSHSPGSLPPPPPVSASSTITPANIRSNSVTFAPPPSATSMTFSHSYSSTTSTSSTPSTLLLSPSAPSVNATSDHIVERVINVQTCPLCHRPRLSAKAEVDIVTHLAICASQDWNKVDRIMVGNFVTASQAQRKWYTRVIGKMSSGNYKLGANSANIIVQNRMTGQLEEEKMQVYVRLGIRLLYKGMKSRMEGSRARRLLKSLSIKQGVKYDSPESVRDILPFIQFHRLDMNEVRETVGSFKTFNQFFYRKLKPDARPVDSPSDSYRLVSAADCRFMAFESVNEATRLWIKGREFSVARLLGDAYKAEADRYNGGALAIFRLAPQDYHRFHSPVDGRIGKMTYISGEYYTVNPQAIRTALDVYGENARKIVPIDSPQFGRVMAVCVGAMMVGTIHTTVEEGQLVKRGEEFGYFAFGGSTIVLLFERGVLEWDEDLLINGRAALETLVRVGMGLGTGLRKGQGNIARAPTPGYS